MGRLLVDADGVWELVLDGAPSGDVKLGKENVLDVAWGRLVKVHFSLCGCCRQQRLWLKRKAKDVQRQRQRQQKRDEEKTVTRSPDPPKKKKPRKEPNPNDVDSDEGGWEQ